MDHLGAAPLPRATHEYLLALGLPIVELYGMSECSCIATVCNPGEARIGTVGKGASGQEARLADDGELLLRGPSVMRGYRNDPERTADAFDGDGWLKTGDIASIDDDGYVRIVDRKKELIINAAGKNMSPANIEEKLKSASPLIGQACASAMRARTTSRCSCSTRIRRRTPHGPRRRRTLLARPRSRTAARGSRRTRTAALDGSSRSNGTSTPRPLVPGGDELTPR